MSKNQVTVGAARLLAVAIGTYEHHPKLEQVVPVTRTLIDLFARCGFVQDHPELVGERVEVETLRAAIQQWFLARKKDDRFLVYWTGHGLPSNLSEHLLAATDTPVDPMSFQAIEPGFLVELLIRSQAQVGLLVIDTCFSGKAGMIAGKQMEGIRASTIPPPDMVGRRIGVLTTSHPIRTITSPVVGVALVKVLSDPDSGSASWGRRDARIGLKQLQEALHGEIGKSAGVHIDWRAWEAQPSGWATDDGRNWLPNPICLGQMPDELVELQRTLLSLTEAGSHWDLSHRGLEVGSSGWAFVGREVTLQKIVAWLDSAPNGVLVVTGPPGSGKSAVVGRLVTLSVETYRARALSAGILAHVPDSTLPPVGVFNAAIHARHKTLLDVINRLAEGFGLESNERPGAQDLRTMTEALVSHLYRMGSEGHISTLAIDALDEARANHERSIAQLCRRLGDIPGVRVLVGVRYSITGDTVPHDKDRHALLKQVWSDGIILDVNDDPNTQADLVRYVDTRIATRHRHEEQRQRIAEAVAERALSGGGYFLYARIVARTLLAFETLPNHEGLPAHATEAFATDLLTRFGRERDRFDDLLGALAWGYGSGLPKTVWTQVASAISAEGAAYEIANVNEVLRRAGSHVIESEDDHQSVYRLGHELLNEYYRDRRKEEDVETRIAFAISEGVEEGGGWEHADSYAVRYLVEHFLRGKASGPELADCAERLVAFCTDPRWLKRVVPLIGVEKVVNLLERTHQVTADENLKVLARVLRRSRVAISQDVNQLAAQLHVRLADTNLQRLNHLVSQLGLLAPEIWLRSRGKLLGWQDDLATQYTVVGTVRALAFGEVQGTTILGIGVDDRVILWDPRSGVGEERTVDNPEGRVTALSIEYLAGDPVLVVAAGYDGTIAIRDYWSGEQVGPAYTGCAFVDSVSVGLVAGRRIVMACGNSQCWMWDQQTGMRLNGVPKVEAGWSVAGVLSVDGRITLSLFRIDSVDEYRGALWSHALVEAGTGVAVWPIRRQQYEPKFIATSVLSRGPVSAAVVAFRKRNMLMGWSPATTHEHQIVGESSLSIQQSVRTLSVGEIDGRVVAAYAPDYEGSGFVHLMDLVPNPEYFWENYVLPSNDPRAVHLSGFEIWSVLESGSEEVQVLGVHFLQSRSRLILVQWKSGSDWGMPVGTSLTPEAVAEILGSKISVPQPASPFFSMRDGEAIPTLLDTVENAKGQAQSALRLRREDPGGWPATVMTRGFLNGRAVLVCGSYSGVIWIWDLKTGEVLAGPFANIPDEFEFKPDKKSSRNKAVTTDIAIGELDGDSIVAAAVAGKVRLYDVKSGVTLPEPSIGSSIVVTVALGSLGGRSVLVTGSRGGVLAVWDTRTAKRITGMTLDFKINGVWVVQGTDAIAARCGNELLIFDLIQNSKTNMAPHKRRSVY